MPTWKVTGNRRGIARAVAIDAPTHGDAVRIASTRRGLLLVVRSCVLQDSELQRAEHRLQCQLFYRHDRNPQARAEPDEIRAQVEEVRRLRARR